MTRLLVSVRNAAEAAEALTGGADLIDAKEPNRGSLGRCDDATVAEIIATVAGRLPVSAALGELSNECKPLPVGLQFAKVGLAGWRNRNWQTAWQQQHASWPSGCGVVAVAYADASDERVAAPNVEEIVEAAIRVRAAALLIDTHLKNGSTLLDWLTVSHLHELVGRCHANNLRMAVAGSLNLSLVYQIAPLSPDWIAVRGAACDGGRNGMVKANRVRELAALIQKPSV